MSKEEIELLTEDTDLEAVEKESAISKRKEYESNIKNLWGYSALGVEAKKAAMSALATSTGMYARIPLICKAHSCPYASFCSLLDYGLAPEGEPCPEETSLIEISHMGYDKDFDLDNASFTDRNLISTIIEYDIMIRRIQTLISKEQDPVREIVAGVNEVTGEEYKHPQVSKYLEALDKTVKKRNDLYQLMMATRKDKKGEVDDRKDIFDVVDDIIGADYVVEEKPENIGG